MPRGGKRDGVAGRKYANRADLRGANVVAAQPVNTSAKLPVATATGQPYGAATAQKNAQAAVPIASQPVAAVPQAQTQGAPQAPQGLQPMAPLNAPTTHGLPLMTGVDAGAGAGSEAIPKVLPFDPAAQALNLLNSLGDNVSPQVAYVRNFLVHQTQNQIPQ